VSGAYEGKQIVGMDLHRRRSVLVRMTESGEHLETVRISNDPEYLRAVMARAGEAPDVVLEAAYGWYWAADTLAELGAHVHLAHPLGVKMFSYRRVKNDQRDAADLADLLRMGRLPEAWIAPPACRELRGWVRHRAKLVGLRSSLKCQVHAVLAGAGVPVLMSDLFSPGGQDLLAHVALTAESRARVDSALRLIAGLDFEIELFGKLLANRLRTDRGYLAIQAIPGVGPVLAAVFVAEIGDIARFTRPAQLASWAGLTPKHHDESPWVRWRLLALETRMEPCRRSSRRAGRPRAGTPSRRRPRRCGWSGRCGPSWAPSTARSSGWPSSSATGSSRCGCGSGRPTSTTVTNPG